MRCVTDANFWIDVYEGSLTKLLFALEVDWLATDVVLNELDEIGRPSCNVLTESGVRSVTLSGDLVDRIVYMAARYPAASPQDLSALVLAQDRGLVMITGDRALREAAEAEGVEVHGTLWVLDRMVDAGIISGKQAANSLEAMVSSDRRLPKGEVRRRLREWGEEGPA